jgi:hypothetical protein
MLSFALMLAASPPIEPGMWELRNEPGAASLAGRPLTDLPLDAVKNDRVCLTPAEAAKPATWFSRDTGGDCPLTRARVAGGKVDIVGTCPSEDGLKPGSVRLTGRYTPRSFDLAFATTTDTAQGVMGFAGRMTGHRVSACDAASPASR